MPSTTYIIAQAHNSTENSTPVFYTLIHPICSRYIIPYTLRFLVLPFQQVHYLWCGRAEIHYNLVSQKLASQTIAPRYRCHTRSGSRHTLKVHLFLSHAALSTPNLLMLEFQGQTLDFISRSSLHDTPRSQACNKKPSDHVLCGAETIPFRQDKEEPGCKCMAYTWVVKGNGIGYDNGTQKQLYKSKQMDVFGRLSKRYI